jgi:hypothetical protein|tara:strand:+ start:207 stop:476 length:270 start_codon:yes stop_codon:yes gene_type:complete
MVELVQQQVLMAHLRLLLVVAVVVLIVLVPFQSLQELVEQVVAELELEVVLKWMQQMEPITLAVVVAEVNIKMELHPHLQNKGELEDQE